MKATGKGESGGGGHRTESDACALENNSQSCFKMKGKLCICSIHRFSKRSPVNEPRVPPRPCTSMALAPEESEGFP